MNNMAIVTVTFGDKYEKVAELSHPRIKAYADRIHADFIVVNSKPSSLSEDFPAYWWKLAIYDYLKKYKRIIFLDTDILIRNDCPDLFMEVPKNRLGAFDEGEFALRIPLLQEGAEKYGLSIGDQKSISYYNSGVLVISRIHRNLFKPPDKFIPIESDYGEQTYLNLKIRESRTEVHKLSYRFNRMTLMDVRTGEDRLACYILHYAGCPTINALTDVMIKDHNQWEKDYPNFEYKNRIHISMGGGLGDQISAEPTVRFIREELYPNDIVYVSTPFRDILHHLKDKIIFTEPTMQREDKAMYDVKTCPQGDGKDLLNAFMSHPLVHPTDFASIAAMRQQLPDRLKTVHLAVTESGLEEVRDIVEGNISDMILVHPGKGWPSKTFPKEWWQEVVDGLVDAGKRIGLIGKYISDDQSYLDVDCPEGVVDFRDMLSQLGFFALVSQVFAVVTNDSAPLHVAGAFDPWIICVPSCKHPDLIAPYRNGGTKYYKTKMLYNKLVSGDIDSRPTTIYSGTIDEIRKGVITDYIPEPPEIIKAVLECE